MADILYSMEKGQVGEKLVADILRLYCNRNHVLTNKFIDKNQIDIILIRPNGVFVIEVKNYDNAYIEACTDKKMWSVFYGGPRRYSMFNPLHQSERHAEIVQKRLPFTKVYNLVVFVGNCKLSIDDKRICTPYNLIDRVNEYKECKVRRHQISTIIDRLENEENDLTHMKRVLSYEFNT